jgi:hypothetical protein
MNWPKRKSQLSLVDFLVGVAVLMILAALVVPVFVPPEGKAAAIGRAVTTVVRRVHR